MKTLDHNAIGRSLAAIGFQTAERMRAKRHEADAYRLAEVFLQFQISVSGNTGPHGCYEDVTINFPEVLYYAPLQRSIKTEDPHVTFGAMLDSGNAMFSVHVAKWVMDDTGNYKGATIRIAAIAGPFADTNGASAFSGTIHVAVQGMGMPIEDTGYDETP